jgi:2-polyprenyl-6-hydroxyphenyl methylase/3-demethylubiquinone-9 3-methyltransferase
MADELRFSFGKNWQDYRARALDEGAVVEAERGLGRLVGDVRGKTFLDVGSGSGLHSLAAHRLGASRIVSFDYDVDSVACTEAVRVGAGAPASWTVQRGSALDAAFVRGLGDFDVVYSWGVLHHTGDMWRAIETTAAAARAPGARYAIAIYNKVKGHLGTLSSESWWKIKRAYAQGGPLRRRAMVAAFVAWRLSIPLTKLKNPLADVRAYKSARGMSYWNDAVDWVGGFPYEYASVAEIVSFVEALGLAKRDVVEIHPDGWGVNEFVFERRSGS